jgi:aminoglycoside phosphotransferase (APT) family kinase protein
MMDAAEATSVLRRAGFEARSVRAVGDGWDHDTFEVDGTWIARFPRRDGVARAFEGELRLLPVLADALPVAVPRPQRCEHDGWVFGVHRKIPGVPLRPGAVEPVVLADAIRALHAFPRARACELLGCEGTPEEWHRVFASHREDFDRRVASLLDEALVLAVHAGFDAFASATFEPVLVHNDLGPEHILVHEDAVGFIDFGDASVGDPAVDFVGLWLCLGPRDTEAVAEAYGVIDPEAFFDRVRFYAWMGAVHAIWYGLDEGDEEEVTDGIEGLRARLTPL